VGNTRRRLSFFVMVLAFSRQMFVEFTVRPARQSGLVALGGSIDAPWGRMLLLGPKSLFQAASVA
jgi:hypothetical protein